MRPKFAFGSEPQFGGERERLGTLVVDEIERFVRGEPLLHRVPHELLAQWPELRLTVPNFLIQTPFSVWERDDS